MSQWRNGGGGQKSSYLDCLIQSRISRQRKKWIENQDLQYVQFRCQKFLFFSMDHFLGWKWGTIRCRNIPNTKEIHLISKKLPLPMHREKLDEFRSFWKGGRGHPLRQCLKTMVSGNFWVPWKTIHGFDNFLRKCLN